MVLRWDYVSLKRTEYGREFFVVVILLPFLFRTFSLEVGWIIRFRALMSFIPNLDWNAAPSTRYAEEKTTFINWFIQTTQNIALCSLCNWVAFPEFCNPRPNHYLSLAVFSLLISFSVIGIWMRDIIIYLLHAGVARLTFVVLFSHLGMTTISIAQPYERSANNCSNSISFCQLKTLN